MRTRSGLTTTTETTPSLRYKHDMEQARQMQTAARRRQAAQQAAQTQRQQLPQQQQRGAQPQRVRALTDADVEVALRGLQQADSLQAQMLFGAALSLYELSLEVLLQALRHPPPSSRYDLGALEAHFRCALQHAEEAKQQKSDDRRGRQASDLTAAAASLTRTLQLVVEQTRPRPAPTTPTVTKKQPTRRPATTSTNITRTHSHVRARPPPSRTGSPHKRPPATTPPTTSTTSTTATTPASPSDGLDQQIMQDFWVDPQELQNSATTWNDIAGLATVKQALQEAAILPLIRPDLFTGLRRPQNLLLFGPPGTGKTLLVRAVAQSSQACLFTCSAASLTSKWMGEAEKVVKALFRVAQQQHRPTIIFLDEIDSVLSKRTDNEHEASRRLKTEFMIQTEGLNNSTTNTNHVLVLACTNCPWDLDPAVLRRFPRRLYVPLPDHEARKALIANLLQSSDHQLSKRDISALSKQLDQSYYSGSDLRAVASEAAFGPVRDVPPSKLAHVTKLRPINRHDWERALDSVTASVAPELVERYQQWQQQGS